MLTGSRRALDGRGDVVNDPSRMEERVRSLDVLNDVCWNRDLREKGEVDWLLLLSVFWILWSIVEEEDMMAVCVWIVEEGVKAPTEATAKVEKKKSFVEVTIFVK